MKVILDFFYVSIIAVMLQSCASLRSGSVVNVINDHEAEVMVDKEFVKAGDKVAFYKTECNTPTPSKHRRCQGTKVGEGKVVSRTKDRAVVRADSPTGLVGCSYVEWVYPKNP